MILLVILITSNFEYSIVILTVFIGILILEVPY